MSKMAFSRVGTRQLRTDSLPPLLGCAAGGIVAWGPCGAAARDGGVKFPLDPSGPPSRGPGVPFLDRLTRLLTSRRSAPPGQLALWTTAESGNSSTSGPFTQNT
ncbi:hypothetical protein GCM10009863_54320 [Streptomyces axinellae]|uniref:Secreted protein n=1 Tax=Streptomyces axinellae TaxID=552788 RepID=A0ABP6D5R5_9ACTN